MPRDNYYLPQRRLVSQDDSAIVANPTIPRTRFMGSFTHKTTFDAGQLIPFLCDEILPGDHMTYDVTAYIRMATALFPIFDNQRVDTFFFFVPNRLVWSNWTKFMGEQATPASSIAYEVPVVQSPAGGFGNNGLYMQFGIPTAAQTTPGEVVEINALPIRAYALIYNEWFRDQNIINSITVNTDDGPDAESDVTVRRRAKSHDYFTSALPWPQKFTAPTVPVAGTAPVLGIGTASPFNATDAGVSVRESAAGGFSAQVFANAIRTSTAGEIFVELAGPSDSYPTIFADLSQATGVAINTLRQAWLVQSLLERDARGGTRYTELVRQHFGVINPDFRLQRPEYIGGGQTPLIITPIAQTAPTEDAPLGALGAAGTAAGGGHRASYAATEHGFIIGIINVRSELSYQQGIHRMWRRRTRYDYYWPSLAGLGEQAILRQELYATGVDADDETIFGYQERWHEYRTRYSTVTGMFRSYVSGTLDAWHLAQEFSTPPLLNQTFIEDTPPVSRVLAAGDLANNQQYLADILIHRTAIRPIPMFGTPVTLGRF